jgi:DNA-binding NarL/FixJ family response regulator
MAMQATAEGSSTSLTLRVVLVDNRSERRQLMRRVVESGHAGAVVVGETEAASDAIAVVGAEQADIVIVEVQLPVDQGLQTIAALRAAYPGLGIVVCSFHFRAETQERARQCGADVYVAKPITPGQLSETLAGMASVPRHWAATDPTPAV